MEDFNVQNVQSEESAESNQKTMGRRQVLKAITATSGAVIASQVLPNAWTKPLIEGGILPAHAATSATNTPQPGATATNTPQSPTATPTSTQFRIFNEGVKQVGAVNNCDTGAFGTGSSFDTFFDYDDPSGNVTAGTKILYTFSGQVDPNTPLYEFKLTDNFVTKTGDGFKGTIKISWCLRFNGSPLTLHYQLKNEKGAVSNTVVINISIPAGALSTGGLAGGSCQ